MLSQQVKSLFVSLLILFSINNLLGQTTSAVNDGLWSVATNWSNGVPVPGGIVIIDGIDIELDEDATVAQIHLSNTSGNSTKLDLKGGGNVLTVTSDMTVTGTDNSKDIHFDIESSDSVYIGNNLTVKRNNPGDAHTHLKIADDSRLTVNGNLNIEYLDGSSSENKKEVEIKDDGVLKINGDLNLTMSGGEELTFRNESHSPMEIAGNVNVIVSGGDNFLFNVRSGAQVDIGGKLSIQNTAPALNATNANILVESSSTLNIEGDLHLISANIDNFTIATIKGSNSELRINTLHFTAVSEEDVELEIKDNAVFYLGGNVNPAPVNSYGTISMDSNTEIHFNGSSPQTIPGDDIPGNGTDNFTFSNVFFESTADSMVLSYPLTIVEDLTLTNGIIKTKDAAPLILADDVTISGGSNTAYVDGPLIKIGRTGGDDFIFPLGNNGIYAPIEIEKISNANIEYTAKFTGCPPPIGAMSGGLEGVNQGGYWDLTRNDGLAVGNVTLHWNDASNFGLSDLSTLVVSYYTIASGWNPLGGTTSGGVGAGDSGSVKNDTGCPPPIEANVFAFGSTDKSENVLPVELSDFTASLNRSNDKINLNWITSSEVNTDYFIVQKSQNGRSFSKLGRVQASQNSTTLKQYYAQDSSPIKGNNYYRIMTVDLDGTMSFSRLINVFLNDQNDIVSTYPNPAKSYINLYSKNLNNKEVLIHIFDFLGQHIYSKLHQSQDGIISIPLETINMKENNTYLINYALNGKAYSTTFIKL